ncbi:nucleotidyltransferase domain-containing protein [Halomonas sp. McH1-25]|uniref:nucleotidyltransferase domain-containing protein n=1 Tax=unclassified Halomonas TaxID=2609666 RepID=UPI001EF42C56|nr:nucleotidyltransferase domain-containing protein [Halomonas sp. McH1-25]MCP1342323.1 nucleotidyltransferase domain-containing protein [Halomonas sp. FL8]MCP1360658.1 nucleotidyltransferase domain-containing protein [Halomonas sp. BBD45]MCP1366393.1 nucleotidyltransferase domain-containing protein [Halomonas sp. BBD48]
MSDTSEIQPSGLSAQAEARIRNVLCQFAGLERAILYGSRAMETYRPGSDIDLTFLGSRLTWHDLQQLELRLDDLLLPYRFDLSLYHQIDNPDLVAHIQRVGVPFYERDCGEPDQ